MRMDPVQLNNKNLLINDYKKNQGNIASFFDYNPFNAYEKRVKDLQSRTFKREDLANVLHTMNKQWDAPNSTKNNIERLRDRNSVVVIGGQQAGLMTGPLYTVNKILSLIKCAKEQEEQLKIPVIPVFWIAGEDHDYDEINHIFLPGDLKMEKHIISQQVIEKKPLSNVTINQDHASRWLNNIFQEMTETEYTRNLHEMTKGCLAESTSYVDFFARFIYKLFAEEGLVLIDSGNKQLRHLESDYFIQLIKQQPGISAHVYNTQQKLNELNYVTPLEIKQNDGHLFVHKNGERILLNRNEFGEWIGKQNEIKLTTDEMIDIAKNTPEMLSNNVISRPLMQEMLFPTLCFVAGEGEISYWSVLGEAFHTLDMKMPPILPRLSITYLPRNIESLLRKYEIPVSDAINYGVEERKRSWLDTHGSVEIEQLSKQLKRSMSIAHKPLRILADQIRSDVGELANKNLNIIEQNIDFLKNRMIKEIQNKHSQQMGHFDAINMFLQPSGGLQERIWNVIPLLNSYGIDLIHRILQMHTSFEEDHYIVYM